ncbi:5903_t:CDS:10, partial [Racocetra fulgida]
MECNETSDYSSNSESGFSTSELNDHDEETILKIAKLKKMIAELEDTSTLKVAKLNKEKKGPLNRSTVQVVDEISDDKTVKPFHDKTSKVVTNKANKVQAVEEISNDKIKKRSLKRSRPQVSDENDTEFSSDDPEQKSMRLIVAEKLYHLCSTTEYRDMPLIEINKCIDKMIRRHVNYKRKLNLSHYYSTVYQTCSTLNISGMLETQETIVSTNKRIKSRKPNGNSKRAKKGKYVVSIEVNESDSNLSEKNTTAFTNKRIKAPKEKHVDHNTPIDINESDQSSSEKNIEPTFNSSEMLDPQDTTTPPNNKPKTRSNVKKGKTIDHNAPINVDDSDPGLSEKNIHMVAPTNNKTKTRSNAKKGKNIDHNAPINVDDSDQTLPERNINTAAPTNNKTKAHKPNGNSKKAKKEKQVYHNAPINVDDNDPTLLEKNIVVLNEYPDFHGYSKFIFNCGYSRIPPLQFTTLTH